MRNKRTEIPSAVFRKPLWQRLLQAFSAVLLTLLTLFVVVMTAATAAGQSWGLAVFFGLMSWALIPIFTFMLRETRASWRWRLDLTGNCLHLTLPEHRSQAHDTPAYLGSLDCEEITGIVTREESYPTLGMVNAVRVFALELTNGELLFLGEDRSQGTSQANYFMTGIAAALHDTFDLPYLERPAVAGKAGYLGITGNTAPAWDAAGMDAKERAGFETAKARTNTILGYISLIVLALLAMRHFS